MAKEKVSIEMKVVKDCKSVKRFGSDAANANDIASNIYVGKKSLERLGDPDRIKVTIEPAE